MKPLKFFTLVLVLSIPFWILGWIAEDLTKILPVKLPISSLMAICPLLAAVFLVYKKNKSIGVKKLLSRAFDIKTIKDKKWYIPIIFLMPVITLTSYWLMLLAEIPLPEFQIGIISALIFFLLFFIGAIGEELGWSGFIIDSLQNRLGALNASILLGIFWAIWHIIPYIQAHQTTMWIFWQCTSMVFLRIIMVWLYNNTGKSVFSSILFHTMINISMFLFPNYGSHYEPFYGSIVLMLITSIIIISREPKSLTQFRFKRRHF